MSDLGSPKEVDPVALTQSKHIEQVLPLHFISVPQVVQDAVLGCTCEFLGGHVGHFMLVF